MRVMVIGSGGREHALCWAIQGSPLCEALFCVPGNAGIARVAECLAGDPEDLAGIVALARERAVDLAVVGPEGPLCAGLVDRLEEAGIAAFGPDAAAAELEGSKGFMKDLCRRYGIPTGDYRRFTDADAAKAYIHERGAPIVVKADGLAAGKGVIVAAEVDEAIRAIDDIMAAGAFGAAGREVVVEDFLEGEEASVLALVDGENFLMLPAAQDHKPVGEGDVGPNTGGMGAYSPAPVITPAMEARVVETVIAPTVAAMRAEGCQFDVVILDPPAFIQRKKDLKKGIAAYRRSNELGLQLLNPGGLLVSGSCSMHLSRTDLISAMQQAAVRAGCQLRVVEQGAQGPDHPIHPAIPETEYLKAIFARKL